MSVATVQIAPTEMKVDNCRVTILEALKTEVLGERWYHIVVTVNCRGVQTKPFTIDARNAREFRAKLLVEIAKLKMLIHMYGPNFAQWLVGG